MSTVIVLTNETASRPEFAGWLWVPMQYMLGFQDLGCDVYWVDQFQSPDPRRAPHSADYIADRFHRALSEFGLDGRGVLLRDGIPHGRSKAEYDALCAQADVVICLGGNLPADSALSQSPRRAFIDVDPGFTQIWALQHDLGLDTYTDFFTVGQNVGRPDFQIPTSGVNWISILPPIHLPSWPSRVDESCRRIGTVADWRGSQDALFDGQYFGSKRGEFIKYLTVPRDAGLRLELALLVGQHDFEDMGLLLGHDWRVREPYLYAGDLSSYREFIQFSRAEFSVAKSGYVRSRAGWVSDRTACYLASGKPALVQSTGFEWKIPADRGLVTFDSPTEAVDALAELEADYLGHATAARAIAEELFDSQQVLLRLLDHLGS